MTNYTREVSHLDHLRELITLATFLKQVNRVACCLVMALIVLGVLLPLGWTLYIGGVCAVSWAIARLVAVLSQPPPLYRLLWSLIPAMLSGVVLLILCRCVLPYSLLPFVGSLALFSVVAYETAYRQVRDYPSSRFPPPRPLPFLVGFLLRDPITAAAGLAAIGHTPEPEQTVMRLFSVLERLYDTRQKSLAWEDNITSSEQTLLRALGAFADPVAVRTAFHLCSDRIHEGRMWPAFEVIRCLAEVLPGETPAGPFEDLLASPDVQLRGKALKAIGALKPESWPDTVVSSIIRMIGDTSAVRDCWTPHSGDVRYTLSHFSICLLGSYHRYKCLSDSLMIELRHAMSECVMSSEPDSSGTLNDAIQYVGLEVLDTDMLNAVFTQSHKLDVYTINRLPSVMYHNGTVARLMRSRFESFPDWGKNVPHPNYIRDMSPWHNTVSILAALLHTDDRELAWNVLETTRCQGPKWGEPDIVRAMASAGPTWKPERYWAIAAELLGSKDEKRRGSGVQLLWVPGVGAESNKIMSVLWKGGGSFRCPDPVSIPKHLMTRLAAIASDPQEDKYIRIEAYAVLCAHGVVVEQAEIASLFEWTARHCRYGARWVEVLLCMFSTGHVTTMCRDLGTALHGGVTSDEEATICDTLGAVARLGYSPELGEWLCDRIKLGVGPDRMADRPQRAYRLARSMAPDSASSALLEQLRIRLSGPRDSQWLEARDLAMEFRKHGIQVRPL